MHKPLLRGYFHQETFFIGLGACALLIAKSSSDRALISSLVYSIGLLTMFGISALYHRPNWNAKARKTLKKLDHSAIFIFIAGTMTPFCLLALEPAPGQQLLIVSWATAAAGVLQSNLWSTAPKYVTSFFYVVMGWLALPYLGDFRSAIGTYQAVLVLAGGILYTVGALVYALKKPQFYPRVFGYHEFFHAFTILAAILHFIVVYQLIQ